MPRRTLSLFVWKSWAHISLEHSSVPLFRVWVTSTGTVTTVRLSLTSSLVLFANSFFYFVVTDPKHGTNMAL